ncbi:hypothetical protein SLEP1_g33872 [Rubroshorea leprosula]|uniref:Reverse transcriptase domain-containing protein n=1 Tax=Rubroshorea leprosula TaxID=152421 RepID=A0AAV5KHZ9_9ROSI|nr:hypothetical protein SLEP1_g33872 [Rubroshorea leprosula]
MQYNQLVLLGTKQCLEICFDAKDSLEQDLWAYRTPLIIPTHLSCQAWKLNYWKMMRRERNRITALKIEDSWVTDPIPLKTHVRDFFVALFSRKETIATANDYSYFQLGMLDADSASLLLPISMEEIKIALFSMKGLKSPGPDGIQPIFYQKHWEVVSAYKILSKVIVNRLRPYLQNLIGPLQSSFLAGRSTTDNIILVQEAIHAMRRLKGKKGAVAFKIDLHKAFDTSIAQIEIIMDCLSEFAGRSGLEINLSKSKLFVSPNIQRQLANSFSFACGIPLTNDLGTYFGVPIIHGRFKASSYKYILEKMQLKLAGWKQHLLSMAGRRTLVQSVTSSIPTYTMQTVLLPSSTCSAIDTLNRNFLWGSDVQANKPHLVQWNDVCLPREYGGLGVRSAKDCNKALIAKLGWQILLGSEKPWCQAMKRSGSGIQFWNDIWAEFLPENVLQLIAAIPLPLTDHLRDQMYWHDSPQGDFTVKEGNSAADFMAAMGHDLALGTTLFTEPPRVGEFSPLCNHQTKIKERVEKKRLHNDFIEVRSNHFEPSPLPWLHSPRISFTLSTSKNNGGLKEPLNPLQEEGFLSNLTPLQEEGFLSNLTPLHFNPKDPLFRSLLKESTHPQDHSLIAQEGDYK